ncbi:MAG: carbohydrate ABC transporter permease [Chloroflexi bacterium]|nr:carbohydrate ABC transporter permease [Chloroflexota bacterium]
MTTLAKAQPTIARTQTARKINWSAIAYYGVLVILALIALFPLYMMFQTSLKRQVDIMSSEPTWIFEPTLENYETIFSQQKFDRYLTNSIVVGLGATFLTLFTAGLASYALARMQFPGRGLVAQSTLLIRMVPTAVLAVPIFALWQGYGIEDGRIGLILFYTALGLPFAIWLLYGFIKQIPIELEEAAIIDGCNTFQVFFQILFPLMRAGYAVAAIFTFRIAWNEFLLALILTNRYTRTLPVETTLYITEQGVEWGRIAAMGTVLVIPPLLLTFVSARQIIQGMTAGAVKG